MVYTQNQISSLSRGSIFAFLSSLSVLLSCGAPVEAKDLLITKENDNFLECIHKSSCHTSKPVNIGYRGRSPVPLTLDCLLPQAVDGVTTTIHSGSPVEPTLAVNPKNSDKIVACWQQGRINNGGALEAGIAYSKDGGKKWKRTTVPLQICDGGINQRISDVWLSYAKDGKRVYLNALVFNASFDPNTNNQSAVVVSTSENNGKNWSAPSFLYSSQDYLNEPTGAFPSPDKNSITADRNIKKNAYVVYDSFVPVTSYHSDTYFNKTTDGGLTWSPFALIYNPFLDLGGLTNPALPDDNQTINNVIVVQPKSHDTPSDPKRNGDLLNFMVRLYAIPTATQSDYENDSFPYQFTDFDIAVIRSQDQGDTWNTTSTVIASFVDASVYTRGYTYDISGNVTGGSGLLLRTGHLFPSYNVNPKNGNLYVAYQTGEFSTNQLPQIGLKASYDGGYTWSNSARVSGTPLNAPNPQAFTPFVAVTKNGYVGILYFDFRKDNLNDPNNTPTNAWLAIYKETGNSTGGSTGIGLDFVKDVRLTKESYNVQNGPTTTQGIMTNGDYAFLEAIDEKFQAIYTIAKEGPFKAPETIYNDVSTSTVLILDDNYRTAPYFQVVKP